MPDRDARLTHEQIQRIHYLLDIDRSLQAYGDDEIAAAWLSRPDRSDLKGRSPLREMQSEGLPGFRRVREMADRLANS